jgi:anti-sigma factor RsiW
VLFEVVNPVGVGQDALAVVVLGAVEAVEGAAAVKVAVGNGEHGHIQLVALAPVDGP